MFNMTPWRKKEQNDIARFHHETADLFNRFFGMSPFGEIGAFTESGLFPKLDVTESDKNVTVKADIPGIEREDVEVYLDGRLLTVKGERKQEKEDKGENYHRAERSYGSFSRTVELPAEVDESDVDASYKDGILKVVMKKTKESESKKIEVKAA